MPFFLKYQVKSHWLPRILELLQITLIQTDYLLIIWDNQNNKVKKNITTEISSSYLEDAWDTNVDTAIEKIKWQPL